MASSPLVYFVQEPIGDGSFKQESGDIRQVPAKQRRLNPLSLKTYERHSTSLDQTITAAFKVVVIHRRKLVNTLDYITPEYVE